MTDPERYTRDGADPSLREGLRALRADRPTAGARERAIAAVLASGTVAAGLTTTSTAAGAVAAAQAAAPTKGALGLLFAKWAAVGVVSATTVLGTYEIVQRTSAPAASTMAPAATPAPVSPARAARSSSEAEPAALPSPALEAPPPASTDQAAGSVAKPPSVPLVASAPPSTSVADEVEQLEAIRSAIRARNGGEARAAVAAYRHAFPKGVLASEAFVLEIEATAIDRPAEARRLAEAFLKRNPTSPLANRVRRAGGLGE